MMTERDRAVAEAERRASLLGEVTMARLGVKEAERRYAEAVRRGRAAGLGTAELQHAAALADTSGT